MYTYVHIPFRKYRTSNAGFPINVANWRHIYQIFFDMYISTYLCVYIYICAYFCTYLDLYNVSLQGNRIQTYSICTLLHLLIKEASQKSQPIHFLLSSCAIYTEKYCAYIYTQYIHLYIYHWETTEPAMLASHYMLCTEYTSIRYIEIKKNVYIYIYIFVFLYIFRCVQC